MGTYNFKNKVALVTGASSGIGEATALDFAKAGASVILADVQKEKGEALVKKILSLDGKAAFVLADMSKEADIKNMIQFTVKTFGRLNYAFNNAGIEGEPADTTTCTNENWDKTININLRGVWQCMKYEIPEMLKVGGGAIVNCSSIAGVVGFAGIPAYVASKHGVLGLTKTAAIEYAKQNIRVNAVCPGVIQTPMIDRFTKGSAEAAVALAKDEPIGRMGKSEEISSAVLWLCSEGAGFVTGHPLVVDGGWVAK